MRRDARPASGAALGLIPRPGELELVEVGIEPLPLQKLHVRPPLDDPPAVHHHDQVAVEHRREPMRDDQRGAAAREPVEGVADQRLALGVERRGRLVEEQDRRVAQDGAGDREALALAAGELARRRRNRRVVAAAAAPG